MNILEALAQLRDDIKTWVTNNLNSLNETQNAANISLEKTLEEKIDKAIQEDTFSGDYNDLINAPLIENNSGELIIIDEKNNIIMKVSKSGLETTDIKANGIDILDKIDSIEGAHVSDIEGINTRINKYDEVFQDIDGDNFTIVDSAGNKIAEFNYNGLTVTNLNIVRASEDINYNLNEIITEFLQVVKEIYGENNTSGDSRLDEHEGQISNLDTRIENLEEAIGEGGSVDGKITDVKNEIDEKFENLPFFDYGEDSENLVIIDGNYKLAEFNKDGLTVTNITIKNLDENNEEKYSINFKEKVAKLEAKDSALDGNITQLSGAINDETERAKAAEKVNADAIDLINNEKTGILAQAKSYVADREKAITDAYLAADIGLSNRLNTVETDVKDASVLNTGTLDAALLADSGVTNGVYGAAQTGTHGGNIQIPSIEVDIKGRVIKAEMVDITLPNINKATDINYGHVILKDEMGEESASDAIAATPKAINNAIDSLPFKDEINGSLIITDENKIYKLAEFNKDGLYVTNIYLGEDNVNIEDYIEECLEEGITIDLEESNEGIISTINANTLGGHLPEYYATAETVNTIQEIANNGKNIAEAAMPKAGGEFTGDVIAYSANRTTSSLRNIEIRTDSVTGTLQSTNKIIMVRK